MTTSTRELRERADAKAVGADRSDDDLGFILVLLWVASVAKVLLALSRHETFGTIATLALLSIVFLPALIWRELKH